MVQNTQQHLPPFATSLSSFELQGHQYYLVKLGQYLVNNGYLFTSITPETHRRVIEQRNRKAKNGACAEACNLRDVFGWNLAFSKQWLSESHPTIVPWLVEGELIRPVEFNTNQDKENKNNQLFKCNVRFSTVANQIYVHSSFPTVYKEAVYLGPDTYRSIQFLSQVKQELKWAANSNTIKVGKSIDIGTGAGVLGLYTADIADSITLTDINPLALDYARTNAQLAGCSDRVKLVQSNLFQAFGPNEKFDLIVSNPPYMIDTNVDEKRLYRDGGGNLGIEIANAIVKESLPRLSDGGTLAIYTGVPIVNGIDPFWESITEELAKYNMLDTAKYFEIDVDVYGEEIETDAYKNVERIAVVGLIAHKKASR